MLSHVPASEFVTTLLKRNYLQRRPCACAMYAATWAKPAFKSMPKLDTWFGKKSRGAEGSVRSGYLKIPQCQLSWSDYHTTVFLHIVHWEFSQVSQASRLDLPRLSEIPMQGSCPKPTMRVYCAPRPSRWAAKLPQVMRFHCCTG